jgi:hypothetical protein
MRPSPHSNSHGIFVLRVDVHARLPALQREPVVSSAV